MEVVCSLAVPMKKMTRKQMKYMKLLTKEWMIEEKKEGMWMLRITEAPFNVSTFRKFPLELLLKMVDLT